MRFYVSIEGLEPEDLAFFGLQIGPGGADFDIYIDRDGEEHIVDRNSPHIFVDDINDATHIASRAKQHIISLLSEQNA